MIKHWGKLLVKSLKRKIKQSCYKNSSFILKKAVAKVNIFNSSKTINVNMQSDFYFQVTVPIVVVPTLKQFLQSNISIHLNAMCQNVYLSRLESIIKLFFKVLADCQAQFLLLPFDDTTLKVNFESNKRPLVFYTLMHSMAQSIQVQIIQLPLLVLIKLLENVVATTIFVNYGISLFPACHHQSKPVRHRSLSNTYKNCCIIVKLKSQRQVMRNLSIIYFETDVVASNLLAEIHFKMVIEHLIVYGGVVEVVEDQRKCFWLIQRVRSFLNYARVDRKVAQNSTFLQDNITHAG